MEKGREEREVALLPTVLSFLKSQPGRQVETQAKYSHNGQKRWCLRGTRLVPTAAAVLGSCQAH